MSLPLKVVVLISGVGSNLQAIIDATLRHNLPIILQAVISSNEHAYGLKRAAQANLPTHIFRPKDFTDHIEYDLALTSSIAQYSPDLILLAGFMRILSKAFLTRFQDKVINIHPSLLPLYPGLNTHQQALADQRKEHGCSIHFVTEEVDGGPLIAQSSVEIDPADSLMSLQKKIHTAEHFLYPTVLKWFAQYRITILKKQIFLDNCAVPSSGYRFKILKHLSNSR